MKRWKSLMALMLALCLVLSGCSGLSGGKASQMDEINGALEVGQDADDYRTTYEVFVYSFYDSDGDGIGDLRGVLEKLDYINDGVAGEGEDLECSEIWLMPI
ncbi:MAG: alpha-amylase, partial [Firmicutes bacterium]|nr:alpha-amylase [Bacillota bacterium]